MNVTIKGNSERQVSLIYNLNFKLMVAHKAYGINNCVY